MLESVYTLKLSIKSLADLETGQKVMRSSTGTVYIVAGKYKNMVLIQSIQGPEEYSGIPIKEIYITEAGLKAYELIAEC